MVKMVDQNVAKVLSFSQCSVNPVKPDICPDTFWFLLRSTVSHTPIFNVLLFPYSKFFIDNVGGSGVGGMAKPVTQEDKAKISQRINRFGKQGVPEGNRKKLSINDLVKSVVSVLGYTVGPNFISLSLSLTNQLST